MKCSLLVLDVTVHGLTEGDRPIFREKVAGRDVLVRNVDAPMPEKCASPRAVNGYR